MCTERQTVAYLSFQKKKEKARIKTDCIQSVHIHFDLVGNVTPDTSICVN